MSESLIKEEIYKSLGLTYDYETQNKAIFSNKTVSVNKTVLSNKITASNSNNNNTHCNLKLPQYGC